MTEEIGKETTAELETANDQHVDLKTIAIVIKGILDGIVESVVTYLSQAQYY